MVGESMGERKHYCLGLKFGLVSHNFLHTTIPIAILFQNTASTLTAYTLANELQACRYLARFCFSSAHGSRTLDFFIPHHILPCWLRTNLSCHRKVTKGLPLSTQTTMSNHSQLSVKIFLNWLLMAQFIFSQ